MAYDKLVDSAALDGLFSGIADAIREMGGGDARYAPSEMPGAIAALDLAGDSMAMASGTAPAGTAQIDTGLASIDYFLIYTAPRSVTASPARLRLALVKGNGENYGVYESHYANSQFIYLAGTNTFFTVSGGTLTFVHSSVKLQDTMHWAAFGTA